MARTRTLKTKVTDAEMVLVNTRAARAGVTAATLMRAGLGLDALPGPTVHEVLGSASRCGALLGEHDLASNDPRTWTCPPCAWLRMSGRVAGVRSVPTPVVVQPPAAAARPLVVHDLPTRPVASDPVDADGWGTDLAPADQLAEDGAESSAFARGRHDALRKKWDARLRSRPR